MVTSRSAAGPTVLILTEDASDGAHDVLTTLVKKMFQVLEPGYRTHEIAFKPANEDAKRAMRGNLWKSDAPRDHFHLTALRRAIASALHTSKTTVVAFHADGDRAWSARSTSENLAKFDLRIRRPVEQLLSGQEDPEERAVSLSRILLVMPFYSIEAWLYQNTETAIRLCRERYRGVDVEQARIGFPADQVARVGKSFAAVVEALLACFDVLAQDGTDR